MPAKYYVVDFQMLHRKLDNAQQAKICRIYHVRNISVREYIAGFETKDRGLRFAGIGASEPENLWCLSLCEIGKEVGILVRGVGGPFFVVLKACLESIVCKGKSAIVQAPEDGTPKKMRTVWSC